MRQLKSNFDKIGAKYPAEHNVGHMYKADDNLRKFYKKLDPNNIFNPGIGKSAITEPVAMIKFLAESFLEPS